MNFYRNHYKITSLLMLSLVLASFIYLEEVVSNKVHQTFTEINCPHSQKSYPDIIINMVKLVDESKTEAIFGKLSLIKAEE